MPVHVHGGTAYRYRARGSVGSLPSCIIAIEAPRIKVPKSKATLVAALEIRSRAIFSCQSLGQLALTIGVELSTRYTLRVLPALLRPWSTADCRIVDQMSILPSVSAKFTSPISTSGKSSD